MTRLYIVYQEEIVQLPVNPSKVSLGFPGNNKTRELVKLGEINIIKQPRLTEISFESFFPYSTGPYVETYELRAPTFYHDFLVKIKQQAKPIQFIITDLGGASLNEFFSVEDYNGVLTPHGDIDYSIKLKEYKPFSARILDANGKVVSVGRVMSKVIPPAAPIMGESLMKFGKKHFGSSLAYLPIAHLNEIKDKAVTVAKGTILKLPGADKVFGASGLNTIANLSGIRIDNLTLGDLQKYATGKLDLPALASMRVESIKSRALIGLRNIPVTQLNSIKLPSFIKGKL